ncbi:MAG: alpha/beta hydrolase [Proteobacteria bacterium]|nr:alpha/beta hydrolase [Pseudomonadota bacterium]
MATHPTLPPAEAIADWDAAYANAAYIPDGESFPARWAEAAAAFRAARPATDRMGLAYGPQPRQWLDLFLPEGSPAGLAVFVHGGYWMALDPASWSHLAAGALARGWAVALPCYRLAPEVRIHDIAEDVATAIAYAAALVPGPLCLAGHSAGGHLVTRMMATPSPLAPALLPRLRAVLSISGLHDLRPLLRTAMNATLRLDTAEAWHESPALLAPEAAASAAVLTCWAGAGERPEFHRQNALLANVWHGLGLATRAVEAPGRHHFDVIDDLADPASALCAAWLGDQ